MTESSRTTDRDASAPTRRAREAIVERHLAGLSTLARRYVATLRKFERVTPESRRASALRLPTWLSTERTAEQLGCSERHVRLLRAQLAARKLIEIVDSTLDNGCGRNASAIVLLRDTFEVDYASDRSRLHAVVVAAKSGWREWDSSYRTPSYEPRARSRSFDPKAYRPVERERVQWRGGRSRLLPRRSYLAPEADKLANQSRPGEAGTPPTGGTEKRRASLRGAIARVARRRHPLATPPRHTARRSLELPEARARGDSARLIARAAEVGWDRALREESRREALGERA